MFGLMENPQLPSLNSNPKIISMRSVLKIYGVFASHGLILSLFTVPVSLDENLKLYYNRELLMEPKKVMELLIFVLCSSIIYFPSVNYFFRRNKNRTI